MSRDWTQEEFTEGDKVMTEKCRLISQKEWDMYQCMRGTMEDLLLKHFGKAVGC